MCNSFTQIWLEFAKSRHLGGQLSRCLAGHVCEKWACVFVGGFACLADVVQQTPRAAADFYLENHVDAPSNPILNFLTFSSISIS